MASGYSSGSIATYTWDFGDNTTVTGPRVSHTYSIIGSVYVKLVVSDANSNTAKNSKGPVVLAKLLPPNINDYNNLHDLRTSTVGMRDMIAKHPTRSGFLLGTAANDGAWYGGPFINNPIAAGASPDSPDQRYWNCAGSSDPTYCTDDPCSTYISWYPTPLGYIDPSDLYSPHRQELRDYIAHEFNCQSPCNALMHFCVERRAWLDSSGAVQPVSPLSPFQFYFVDQLHDYTVANKMAFVGGPGIWWLPAWVAYGAAQTADAPMNPTGRVTPQRLANALHGYVQAFMQRYKQQNPSEVFCWSIVNEMIKDYRDDYSGTDPCCATLEDLIKKQNLIDQWPGTLAKQDAHTPPLSDEYVINRNFWWPWYILSDRDSQTANNPNNIAADFLQTIFKNARNYDPTAKLYLRDYGIEFRYRQAGIEQNKYRAARRLVHLFRLGHDPQPSDCGQTHTPGCAPLPENDESVPIDGIALQAHLSTWSFLTYDPNDSPDGSGLRLNPNQLINVRESLRGFEEQGLRVCFSEMDLRMGIPVAVTGPLDGNDERPSLDAHLGAHAGIWTGERPSPPNVSTIDLRTRWQGLVYEALLNACLAVKAFDGIIFYDTSDETSWLNLWRPATLYPYTPGYPQAGASSPCLFGDDPNRNADNYPQRQSYFPKPAYQGVRKAIANYFGNAFSVRNADGVELVRFVENGNILLMRAGTDSICENEPPIPDPQGGNFIVEAPTVVNGVAQQHIVAAITPDGKLHLAGHVYENGDLPLPPATGCSFKVKCGDTVVSYLDEDGNLVTTGYILLDGIPRKLLAHLSTDQYLNR